MGFPGRFSNGLLQSSLGECSLQIVTKQLCRRSNMIHEFLPQKDRNIPSHYRTPGWTTVPSLKTWGLHWENCHGKTLTSWWSHPCCAHFVAPCGSWPLNAPEKRLQELGGLEGLGQHIELEHGTRLAHLQNTWNNFRPTCPRSFAQDEQDPWYRMAFETTQPNSCGAGLRSRYTTLTRKQKRLRRNTFLVDLEVPKNATHAMCPGPGHACDCGEKQESGRTFWWLETHDALFVQVKIW